MRPSNNYALSVLLMGMTTHNLVNESVSVFYVYSKLLLKKLANNTTFYNLNLFFTSAGVVLHHFCFRRQR